MQRSLVIQLWFVDRELSLQRYKILQSSTAGFHLFVKVPDSWPRIKDHLQAEGNECSRHFQWGAAVPTSQSKNFCQRQGVCQWKSRSQRWDIFQCDSSEIVIVIVGFLVAPTLETQRFTGTNIPVVFVGSLECFNVGDYFFCSQLDFFKLFFRVMTHISQASFQDESNTDLFVRPSKTDFYLSQCRFSPCSTSHLRSWGVRSHFKRRGSRKVEATS